MLSWKQQKRKAYEKRRKGDNKNAILEAGKAFESTMKIICDKQGYTYDDYLVHKELYKETSSKDLPAFNVTAKFKLEGNSLVVSVPFG